MVFKKKTWKNRIAEYINRRRITMEDGSASLVTVARDEGTISQEGDAFNAANMNDLEDRIEAGFADVSQSLKNTVDLTTYDAFAAGVNKEFDTYAEYALNNPSGDIFAIWDMRLEIFRSYARIHGAVTPKAALGDATHLYGLFNLTNYGIKPKGSGVTVIPFDYPIAKFTHVDGDNNIYCNPLFFKINPTGYVEGCVDKYNLVKNTGYCDITFPIVFIA